MDFDPVGDAERGALIPFRGSELSEMIDDDAHGTRAVFVLFWHTASPLSLHARELWARAGELWHRQKQASDGKFILTLKVCWFRILFICKFFAISVSASVVVLGSVACHEEPDVCRAFAISHSAPMRQQQLYAFRAGKRVAHQIGVGDPHFLVQWQVGASRAPFGHNAPR